VKKKDIKAQKIFFLGLIFFKQWSWTKCCNQPRSSSIVSCTFFLFSFSLESLCCTPSLMKFWEYLFFFYFFSFFLFSLLFFFLFFNFFLFFSYFFFYWEAFDVLFARCAFSFRLSEKLLMILLSWWIRSFDV